MIYAFLPFTFGLLAATGLDNILELMKGKKIDQKIIKRVIIVFGTIFFFVTENMHMMMIFIGTYFLWYYMLANLPIIE